MEKAPPRIPPLPREEWTDASREVFCFWGEPNAWEEGSKTNIVNTLATNPPLAMAYNNFAKHLLLHSLLPIRPRELVILRTSWLTKCDYEWHYHVGYGLTAGLTLDEIAAIREGAGAANWNEEDRAVLAAVDELWESSRISDATWAMLARHFDKRAILDLLFTIGHYVMLSWALIGCGTELEGGADQIGYDLKTRSGAPIAGAYKPGEIEDWENKSGLSR